MSDWRTKLIRQLQDFNWNDADVLVLPDDQQEAIDAVIVRTCQDLCEIAGHDPVRDQCGMPEHDLCSWCSKRMPGQATVGR